ERALQLHPPDQAPLTPPPPAASFFSLIIPVPRVPGTGLCHTEMIMSYLREIEMSYPCDNDEIFHFSSSVWRVTICFPVCHKKKSAASRSFRGSDEKRSTPRKPPSSWISRPARSVG